MKHIQNRLILLSLLFFTTAGCIGPMLNHEVGRSLGDGNHNIKAMSTVEGYYGLLYDYGLTENFDLGIRLERLNLGVHAKYSFINQKSGFAFAGDLGTGATFGGSYYTVALLSSYRAAGWEPFSSLRYTKVDVEPTELRDADTGDVFTTIPEFDFDYLQLFLGTKYHFADWFALSAEAGSFVASNDAEFDANVYFSLGGDFYF